MTLKGNNRLGKNFSKKTRRDLAERVAYMCSDPNCRKLTIKPKAGQNIAVTSGQACHIISASPRGPRGDVTISDKFIRSFENGIWLCDKCAREVDANQSPYSKEELTKWKTDAEIYVETLVTQDTRLRQLRILTQSHLSALRILSGLPVKLDLTFNNPNGNGINMTRLFIELELILFENHFLVEASLIGLMLADFETVSKFIDDNKTERPINIWEWKKAIVRLMMLKVMQHNNEAYDRFLKQDGSMMDFALSNLKKQEKIPISLPLDGLKCCQLR